MDVSHINSTVLRRLLSLSEKKENLLKQIASIEKEIGSISTGRSVSPAPKPAKAPSKGRKSRKRGKRGALKGKILSILSAAGDSGARVKDIATQIGVNPQNVHVWFSSTGKKLDDIVRVAAGHYKISAATPKAANVPKAKKKPAAAKSKK